MATPVIGLETLVDGQNGAEIVVNEALYLIDAMLGGITQETGTPPGSPAEGDALIVGTSPSGVFVGHAGEIAIFSNAVWSFYAVGPVRSFWSTAQNIPCEFFRDGSAVTSRVVSIGAGPNATTKSVAHGITPNLNKPMKIEFFASNGTIALYGTSEALTYLYSVTVDATNVNVTAGADMSGFTCWARLEFVD